MRRGLVGSVLRGVTRALGRDHGASRSPATRALASTEPANAAAEGDGEAPRARPIAPTQPLGDHRPLLAPGGGDGLGQARLSSPPARKAPHSHAARLPGPRDSRALGGRGSRPSGLEQFQGVKQHPFIRTDTAGSFLVPLNSAITLQRLNRSAGSGNRRQPEGQAGSGGGHTDSTEFGQPALPFPHGEQGHGAQGAASHSECDSSSKSASDSRPPDILLASAALSKLRKQQQAARVDRNSAYKAEAEALVPAASAHLYYSFATAMVRGRDPIPPPRARPFLTITPPSR